MQFHLSSAGHHGTARSKRCTDFDRETVGSLYFGNIIMDCDDELLSDHYIVDLDSLSVLLHGAFLCHTGDVQT